MPEPRARDRMSRGSDAGIEKPARFSFRRKTPETAGFEPFRHPGCPQAAAKDQRAWRNNK